MSESIRKDINQEEVKEIILKAKNGMTALIVNILLMLASIGGIVWGIILVEKGEYIALGVTIIVISTIYFCIAGPILFGGLKVLKMNEALVLTLFGKYYGTLKGEGFYFVNPFVTSYNPSTANTSTGILMKEAFSLANGNAASTSVSISKKKISLKAMTLNNDKQKINDQLGNPIIIGVVVIWKVVNTAKAVFSVDNFTEFLSIQTDSALRDIVRMYPYDSPEGEDEYSLRGSSKEVASKLKKEIQSRVDMAGLEIIEARITQLAYAPEIASAMLQRQQATAIIEARQKIVEGAVGMVDMALDMLSEGNIVALDDERKAAMVSNLLVVLCANKDPQPIVNSGSIY